ncbi:MAG: trypsin-like peptidase domain-containing protein [Planctomycetota bacterium]|jgi:serine protease Do
MKRITTALIVLLGLAAVFTTHPWSRRAHGDQTPQEQAALKQAHDLSLAFQRANRLISPSVVFIEASQWQGDRRIAHGQGSGFVVRPDGYIMTNNHVVAEATRVRVVLTSGREYEAQVVGTDAETDLAVIKIDARGLEPARFGDSDAIEVGQWVLAVGSPFGIFELEYENTVTAGIVSAKGRQIRQLSYYGNLIQTDAAINPGNSGGPLVNLNGEVIGVNNAITTSNGVSMGVGFAVPANMARSVLESILAHGRVVRGWIGVTMRLVTPEIAEGLGFAGQGVVILEINEGGPADRAGLRAEDIVTTIDGRPVDNSSELQNVIARSSPGTEIELGIFRDGRRSTKSITLGERPSLDSLQGRLVSRELGITVQVLTPDLARQSRLGIDRGVVVVAVEPEGFAGSVGIRRGDIILSLGDREIDSADAFRRALEDFDPEDAVQFRIRRGGTTFELVVE